MANRFDRGMAAASPQRPPTVTIRAKAIAGATVRTAEICSAPWRAVNERKATILAAQEKAAPSTKSSAMQLSQRHDASPFAGTVCAAYGAAGEVRGVSGLGSTIA